MSRLSRLVVLLGLVSASTVSFAGGRFYGVSLLSPIGKVELSAKAEESGGRFYMSSLSSGRAGAKVGEAVAWRLERPGAVVDAKIVDRTVQMLVLRVATEADGTPALLPMTVTMPLPSKGGKETLLLPDGSTLTLSGD